MTDAEKREASRQFYQKWVNRGKEDEDDRSYWIDILQRILGVENATDHIVFQKKVIVDGHTKRIDAYIPETKVLIEQKSLGISLNQKTRQSGGIELTPYEQAKRYNDHLPSSEKVRWIVTSNFSEIWVYDMDTNVPEQNITVIDIKDLQTLYSGLDFLVSKEVKKISEEMKVSLQAGELVGAIYDAFLKQYKHPDDPESLKSLNKLCVRLVFCLYAEDAGIFGAKNMFHDYLVRFDAQRARKALRDLFRVLDQDPDKGERDPYLADDDPILASFPYVNGGLFADENIEIPPLTDEILNLILRNASDNFNWSQISPTIFGAVFESTLNPETRRSGGMHYTSIENIHKVIDPLFLDNLKAELAEIKAINVEKTKERRLKAFQSKLASIRWLDPACGSGNFLTETYISIRRLENETLSELQHGQIVFGVDELNPIQVSIAQFYGIEINDFAVTVAKTALWIAESQMMKETEDVVHMPLDFLPLTTNAFIVEGNALQIDWETVVPKPELTYIMGNPPFVGKKEQTKTQKADLIATFGVHSKNAGNLDYVSGWYIKAAQYISGTKIQAAFVSTNSITQGEQVSLLWKPMLQSYKMQINFAFKTFKWDSEASIKAHVHCVIVGFGYAKRPIKVLYSEKTEFQTAKNISPYLIDAPDILVEARKKPLWDVPEIVTGNQATDDGNFFISPEEIEPFLAAEPLAKKYIRKCYNSQGFINGKFQYCLWLVNASPADLKKMPSVIERVKKVRNFRLNSPKAATRKQAETPTLFTEIRQPTGNYIVIPKVSSENRRYIPLGFLQPDVICNNTIKFVPDATLYHFGVLSSNVHNSWMRTVAGRMKSDYQYSNTIVYNNFPWPEPTEAQIQKIKATAQAILNARALYPDSSLADLYDPLTMPKELQQAHRANDRAVMQAYGFSVRDMSEADCVAALMQLYQEKTK